MASSLSGFTSRYATALYDLAEDSKRVDEVASDLRALLGMVESSPDLERLISSPAISSDEQKKAMVALLKKAGADKLVIQFVGVVASNGRLFALPQIIESFLEDLAKRRGEISAEVISAVELDKGMLAEVKKAVSRVAGSDKISLSVKTDASLIGGLVVRIGSRMIDTSIKSKLNRLELALKGTN